MRFKISPASLCLLNLSRNKLTRIDENLLKGLSNLYVLHLDRNGIKEIDEFAFSDLSYLSQLDLSNNKIQVWDRICSKRWPNFGLFYSITIGFFLSMRELSSTPNQSISYWLAYLITASQMNVHRITMKSLSCKKQFSQSLKIIICF
jgi:Leucine-rich repeat (LRR) protein